MCEVLQGLGGCVGESGFGIGRSQGEVEGPQGRKVTRIKESAPCGTGNLDSRSAVKKAEPWREEAK